MRLRPRVVGFIVAGALVLSAAPAWASDQRVLSHPVSAPAQKVPPKQWGRDVCTAVNEWQEELTVAEESIRSDLDTVSDLSAARDALVSFLGTAVQETDAMLTEVRDAGVPKVDDGKKVARVVDFGLTDLRNLFVEAEQMATELSTTDPAAFRAGTSDIDDTLTDGGDELEEAFDRAERRYKSASRALDHPACE